MQYFWKQFLRIIVITGGMLSFISLNATNCKPILGEEVFPQLKSILKNVPETPYTPLAIQLQRVVEAEGNAIVSRSAILPRIGGAYNFNETYQRQEHQPGITRMVHYGNLNLTQPVFHWGGRLAESQKGQLRLAMSKEQYGLFVENLKKQIRETFLEICLQKKGLQLATKQLALAEQKLDLKEDYKAQGKIIDLEYEEEAINSEIIKNNIKKINGRLHYLTTIFAQMTDEGIVIDEEAVNVLKLLEEIKEKACDLNPTPYNIFSFEYRQLEKELCIEKNEFLRIRSQSLPLVNFQGGFYQDLVDSISSNAQDNRYNLYGGINISWNIFDGCATMGQKIASKARQRILNLQMKQALKKQELEMENQATGMQETFEEILLKEKEVKLGNQKLQTKRHLYEEDRISEAELAQFEIFKEEAEYRLLASIVTYLNQSNQFYIQAQ